MAQPLIILGASGNVWDLLDIIDAINAVAPTWNVKGILDDRREIGSEFATLKILGPTRNAMQFSGAKFINAIRSEKTSHRMQSILAATGLDDSRFATLIHPGTSVSSRATIGRDVFINHGVSVAGNVTLADHVSLGPNCIVGHDAMIESYTSLAPGAIVSGAVHIDQSCYIGAGATIKQQLRIGARALVGMGAVVVKDVEPQTTVVGNPARPIHHQETIIV